MTKPVIVKRATKGSHLTFTELDNNFQNLDDATISIAVSGGDTVVNDLNGTATLVPSDEIFFTADNTAKTITVSENIMRLYTYVHNAEGAFIPQGRVVYLYQATGDKPSIKLASNASEATSSKVLGLLAQDLGIGEDGYVITQGKLNGINTSAFAEGDTVYLGTGGAMTTTKPYAPAHIVYVGVICKVSAGNGEVFVRPQNGWELDEIHDVDINHTTSLLNNHYLRYNSSSSLWQNAALDIVHDTSPQLGGNLDVNGKLIQSTSNANIEIQPNGTGDVYLTADLIRVGDGGSTATISSNGTGDLVLNTNNGTNSGSITISQGANANITLAPNGTGDVYLDADTVRIGDSGVAATIASNGSANIILAPGGTGKVQVGPVTFPSSDGTSGQTLTTNGSGVLSWGTITSNPTSVTYSTRDSAGGYTDSTRPGGYTVYNTESKTLQYWGQWTGSTSNAVNWQDIGNKRSVRPSSLNVTITNANIDAGGWVTANEPDGKYDIFYTIITATTATCKFELGWMPAGKKLTMVINKTGSCQVGFGQQGVFLSGTTIASGETGTFMVELEYLGYGYSSYIIKRV